MTLELLIIKLLKSKEREWRRNRTNNAYNNRREDAVPIDPLASRKLDAIGDHLIEVFTILGLRLIPNIDGGEVDPTPTAAPVELIIGALAAEYLKPIAIV